MRTELQNKMLKLHLRVLGEIPKTFASVGHGWINGQITGVYRAAINTHNASPAFFEVDDAASRLLSELQFKKLEAM